VPPETDVPPIGGSDHTPPTVTPWSLRRLPMAGRALPDLS